MSVSSGPYIVTSGLVFNYDMNNTGKSWVGRPTTNTATGVNLGFGGERWSNVSAQDYPNKNNLPFTLKGPVWRLANGNNYWGYAGDFAITAGNTYSISGWYYVATTETMLWYNDVWNSSYVSVVSSVASDTFVSTNSTNGWRYGSKTLTVGAATSPLYVRGTITSGSGDTTPTGNVYMANFQIEQQSFATPFVNGTRSNTQALLDLTGTNTVTTTSLTYASDNTFSYNGTSDYIECGNLSALLGSNVTVSTFARVSSIVSKNTLLSLNGVYNFFLPGNRLTTTYQLYWDSASGWKNGNTTNWNVNQWYNLTWTISGTTLTFYVNGVADGTATLAGNIAPSSVSRIGLANAGEYATGSIGAVQVYNRALSASEIAQNFNAQRSIYGI